MRFSVLVVTAALALCVADETTVFEFSRYSNTCDREGDQVIDDGTARVVWSYNDQDPLGDVVPQYHGPNRGSKSLNLKGDHPTPVPLEPDAQYFDLRMDEVDVLTHSERTDTLYYCKNFDIPAEIAADRRHVVRIEPVIEEDMLPHVHHIVAWMCPFGIVPDLEVACDMFPPCEGRRSLFTWTIGAGSWDTPEVAGFPMGPGEAAHMYLEMHYDNPQLLQLVDSSGLRFWTTRQLRKFDAGTFAMGNAYEHIAIPPGEPHFHLKAQCPTGCTTAIPPEGVQAFGVLLHEHLIGVEMNVKHIRDGKEIGVLLNNPNYDFDFQETVALKPEVTLLPGDEFETNCYWDSTARTDFTYGGETTRDEMCNSFIVYYPRVLEIGEFCISTHVEGTMELDNIFCETLPFDTVLPTLKYEPLPVVDACADWEKPPMNVVPTPISPSEFDPASYGSSTFLDIDQKYKLYWRHDHLEDVMHFAVEVQTTGWVGIGFSPGGGMIGADVAIGWVNATGAPHFADRFATAFAEPLVDVSQDMFDIRAFQAQL